MLPTTKSKITNALSDETILVYGRPKIGKSTFCSGLGNVLFLDSEYGLKNLSVYKTPVETWESLGEVRKELAEQVKAGKCIFDTLVFDTIDNIYQMCSDFVCKRAKIGHPSDLEFGKGWNMVRTEFNLAMTSFRSLGLGIIYVSHAEEHEIKSRVGNYTRYEVTMSGQAQKNILPTCDFILYADQDDNEKENRILRTKPSKYWNAGDKTGILPETIPLDAEAFKAEYMKAIAATTNTTKK